MYILELIAKIIKDHREKKSSPEDFNVNEEDEKCNHVYVAIDSTKSYFACNNCGKVIANKDIKIEKNIFKKRMS